MGEGFACPPVEALPGRNGAVDSSFRDGSLFVLSSRAEEVEASVVRLEVAGWTLFVGAGIAPPAVCVLRSVDGAVAGRFAPPSLSGGNRSSSGPFSFSDAWPAGLALSGSADDSTVRDAEFGLETLNPSTFSGGGSLVGGSFARLPVVAGGGTPPGG
jgi:hypothetical protein